MASAVRRNKTGNVRIQVNTEILWCDHCRGGKAICITYFECMFVVLVILHAMRTRHSHLWHGRLYNVFPHYLTKGTLFEQESY